MANSFNVSHTVRYIFAPVNCQLNKSSHFPLYLQDKNSIHSSVIIISLTFEQSKNIKAIVWTVAIHVALLILFITFSYTLPPPAPMENFSMEVNLGIGTEGFGDDQPELPDDPAAPDVSTAAYADAGEDPADTKEIVTTSNSDAPEVLSKPKTTDKKPVSNKDNSKKKKPVSNQPVANNAKKPTREKPKYTYPGETGKGGNSAANNRSGGNEGIGSGAGDMGVPGGTPGAKNYVGTSFRLGNRKMIARPDPNAAFREGGQVVINVTVNREGKIVSYRIKSAASTALRKIAEQKITAVRFNAAPDAPVEQFGDITFMFKATRE